MTSLAAQGVMRGLHKKFPNARMLCIASDMVSNNDFIPSSSVSLNRVIGCGGFKSNKIYEVYGPPSSGKSLIMYDSIMACQKAGKVPVLVDAERSCDGTESLAWMARQGVDPDNLIYIRDSAEESLEMLLATCENPDVGLQVIDSIAFLSIEEELKKQMDEQSMRSIANLLPKFTRKWNTIANGPALVCINQIREVMGTYLGDISTPGGHGFKHACAARLEVRGKRLLVKKAGKNVDIGLEINFKSIKNKLVQPRKSGKVNYIWGIGIDRVEEVVRLGVECGLIARGGTSWYSFTDDQGLEHKFNGQPPLVEFLRERDEAVADLATRIAGVDLPSEPGADPAED